MEWISVKDRLPEVFIQPVLIARDEGVRCVLPGYYSGEKFISTTISGSSTFINPTHWIPLPPPPVSVPPKTTEPNEHEK